MAADEWTDSVDRLSAAINDANVHGYFGEEPELAAQRRLCPRTRTIAHYLDLLGYASGRLPAENSADGLKAKRRRDAFAAALAAFQADAGLTVTGRADEETWKALMELASFEHAFNAERWFRRAGPVPVLKYAVHLRLFALGLCKLPPQPTRRGGGAGSAISQKDLLDGLRAFSKIADLLGLSDHPLADSIVPSTARALFDLDAMGRRIASHGGTLSVHRRTEVNPRQARRSRREAEDFIGNLARIELWLYGYEIRIGNPIHRRRFQRAGRRLTLEEALEQFLETQMDGRVGQAQERALTRTKAPVWLFERLLAPSAGGKESDRPEDAAALANQALGRPGLARDLENAMERFSLRLFDGLKRVWRWIRRGIGRIIRAGVRAVKGAITNAARFLHHAAGGVYERVIAALRALAESLRLLGEPVVEGSDIRNLYIRHDRDFDLELFINEAAEPEVVANLGKRLAAGADILLLTAKMIGDLLGLVVAVARRVAVAAWFGLLLALVELRESFSDLRRYSAREVELMSQLDAPRTLRGCRSLDAALFPQPRRLC